MRHLAAALMSAALLAHGVAAAAHPVACSMAGTVTSGHCCCDVESGEAGMTASCGATLELPAVATTQAPSPALQPPAPGPVTALAWMPPPPRPLAPAPPDAGPSPPLPILHRALLR